VVILDRLFGIIPAIFAYLIGKNIIYMEYNIWPWVYTNSISYRFLFFKLHVFFGRLLSKFASVVTVNSPSIEKGMVAQGISSSKIVYLPTGIYNDEDAIKTEAKIESQQLRVLYIGRLVEERGADLLPKIIKRVLKKQDNILFRIAGGGILYDSIKESLKEEIKNKNVILLGQVGRKEAIKLMADSDITLFISKKENFGSLALLECMAAGCPVIATSVGNTFMIVKNGFNGILVDPDADLIAEVLLEVSNNRESLKQMEKNCKETAKKYEWGVIANKFLEMLKRVRKR